MATTLTVGQSKVEVLKERLLSINPSAEVTALHKTFTSETADDFDIGSYDYVVDAIDSLKDKALLILTACQSKVKLFSSMGAALKMNPSLIKVAEFWKVEGDPLARSLRRKFKTLGQYPECKFLCVYSDERQRNKGNQADERDTSGKRVNGTVAHITAIFGLTLAGLIIQDITKG